MRNVLIATMAAAALLGAPAASACVAVIATDPETGETYTSGTDAWLRWEQARWREQSEVVIMAQAREGRMIDAHDVEYILTPFATVYGGDLPKTNFSIRWSPGHTCNRFQLTVSSVLIVYVGRDGGMVGYVSPDMLQDRPPSVSAELRRLRTQPPQ